MITNVKNVLLRPVGVIALVVALLVAVAGTTWALNRSDSGGSKAFPHSAAMESQLGVRFSRLAVVGDGGLVEVNFVVLDVDKATEFEASLAKPPIIVSEDRTGFTKRISVMKQGHNLAVGQTYYLVYENTRGVIVSGGHATIVDGSLALKHVPVL